MLQETVLVYGVYKQAVLMGHAPMLQVGIGAFVLNEKREMLLVQEKLGVHEGQASAHTLSASMPRLVLQA